MAYWSRYLQCNPETYAVLAALDSLPQGRPFADIADICNIESSQLRRLLNRMERYNLVEHVMLGRKRPSWRIAAKSYAAVHSLLVSRECITVQNTVQAGA